MKKIRFGMGGILMAASMLISDRFYIIGIYVLAAAFHEIGHLVAAKLLKIEVEEIRFGFSGIRIVTDSRLVSYKRELLLALAGPLFNLAAFFGILLGFECLGAGSVFLRAEGFMRGESDLLGAVGFFALSSLVQAIMNLLPVKTFDGGRIIYCAIADKLGQRAAEQVIDIFSALSAVILWALALYLMLRISAGLGIFVFSACIFASAWQKERECSLNCSK